MGREHVEGPPALLHALWTILLHLVAILTVDPLDNLQLVMAR